MKIGGGSRQSTHAQEPGSRGDSEPDRPAPSVASSPEEIEKEYFQKRRAIYKDNLDLITHFKHPSWLTVRFLNRLDAQLAAIKISDPTASEQLDALADEIKTRWETSEDDNAFLHTDILLLSSMAFSYQHAKER